MTPIRDQQAVTISIVLLVLSGVFTLLYGPIVPLLPGLVDRPEPLGAAVLAAAALAAAFGIWRRAAWGRLLGLATGVVLLFRDLVFVGAGRQLEIVSVLLDLMLLYVLIRGTWGMPGAARRP
jgi:hypothetical protein